MTWFLLTLLCAFSWAVGDALAKRALARDDSIVVAATQQSYAAPFLWLLFPFIPMPHLGRAFAETVALVLPFELGAVLLYVAAIKRSPLSLTLPYLAFTPAFLVGTAYVVLGERVTLAKGAGILVVTAGAYVLNTGSGGRGILAPIRAIARERGSMMMLAVAVIYSLTASLDKKAVLLSSPEFFSAAYFTLLAVLLAVLVIAAKGPRALLRGLTPNRYTVAMGLAYAVMIVSHNLAIRRVEAAYMISVKRTSMLFGILFGWLFFGEKEIRRRLAGAAIMLAGIFLIVWL